MNSTFADTTDEYKEFLTYFHKLYDEGILDPETFTQDSSQAQAKFFRGDSYVLAANYQQLSDILSSNKMTDEGAELYFMTTPSGPAGNLKVSVPQVVWKMVCASARTLWMSWEKKNSSKCFVLLTGCGTLMKVMS